MADYGYETNDYGYGEATPDYGYGDTAPADFGYGDAAPSSTAEYGYGSTDDVYGYGDTPSPAQADAETKRPKRRCSVTKYSLVSAPEGSVEAAMAQNINAAEMMQHFRNGGTIPPAEVPAEDAKAYSTSSTTETMSTDEGEHEVQHATIAEAKKHGKLSKLRKRLSIF